MNTVTSIRRLLKITYGVVPIVAGVDKFFNVLVDWKIYLSPFITDGIGVEAAAFMGLVGVIEIVAGVLVLSKWTKVGSAIVGVWLVLIALNLILSGQYYDVAVRDVVIAIGAFALFGLTSIEETASDTAHDDAPIKSETTA